MNVCEIQTWSLFEQKAGVRYWEITNELDARYDANAMPDLTAVILDWTVAEARALRDTPLESVPINALVRVPGTPLADQPPVTGIELVRMVATARIMMPRSRVRLSAGRTELTEEAQLLALYAGANSIFYGDRLLTTPNPEKNKDADLLARAGLKAEALKSASSTQA